MIETAKLRELLALAESLDSQKENLNNIINFLAEIIKNMNGYYEYQRSSAILDIDNAIEIDAIDKRYDVEEGETSKIYKYQERPYQLVYIPPKKSTITIASNGLSKDITYTPKDDNKEIFTEMLNSIKDILTATYQNCESERNKLSL